MLDPNRLHHKKVCAKELEKVLNEIILEKKVNKICGKT